MTKQEKIEASLSSALASAFAEIEAAMKDAKNPHFKSKYADITAVIAAIKPALINNNLYFTQRPEPSERGVLIETVVGHAGGEEMSLGKLFVPANKQDAQGFGSALTYARRYALVTAFGVPVEDDDGNAAVASQKAKAPADQLVNDRAARGRNNGPTKGDLDTAEKRIVGELEACADEGMIDDYMRTKGFKADKDLLEEFRPSALYGPAPRDCPEYEPIEARVKRLRAEFRQKEPNVLMAG